MTARGRGGEGEQGGREPRLMQEPDTEGRRPRLGEVVQEERKEGIQRLKRRKRTGGGHSQRPIKRRTQGGGGQSPLPSLAGVSPL